MKLCLVLLSLTLAFQAFASGPGTVEGICQVGNKAVSFKAQSGEKIALGIFTGAEGEAESIYNVWSVEVANYQSTPLQSHGALFIALARPVGARVVVDPPMLCPQHPESLRLRCERVNQDRLPRLEVNTQTFELETRHAGVSDLFVDRRWHKTVSDGFATSLQAKVDGRVDLNCIAKFSIE